MIKLETVDLGNPPTFATAGSAGLDFYAYESLVIRPLQRAKVRLGVRIKSMPANCFLDLRIRSGLAINHGLSLINGAAVIDSDYKDELMALIINLGDQEYIIKSGDKIVQGLVIMVDTQVSVNNRLLDKFGDRLGGFGSTGV